MRTLLDKMHKYGVSNQNTAGRKPKPITVRRHQSFADPLRDLRVQLRCALAKARSKRIKADSLDESQAGKHILPCSPVEIVLFCIGDSLSTFADRAHIVSWIFLVPPTSSVNSMFGNTLMAMGSGTDAEIIAALPIVDVVSGMETRPCVIGNLVAL